MLNNKWFRAAIPALLIHICIGSVYCWSLLKDEIALLMNCSVSSIEFAFSLAIFFLGMSAAFAGNFVEKNVKISSGLSCIFFTLGLMLSVISIYNQSITGLMISYGCIMGIGLGIGYLSPVKTLMLWFKEQKGFATGIAVCAFGFASAVASPIITFLLSRYSLGSCFVILAGIYFLPMFVAHLLIKKPEWYQENKNATSFSIKKTVLNPYFILIWLIFFLNISAGLSLISVASPMLKSLSVTPKIIAIIVSIMGIFNGVGRLIFSAISDRLKSRCVIYLIISCLAYAISVLAQIKTNNILVPIALIVVSACYGAGFSCLPSLLSDIFGMENISKIHGITLTAWAVAGLVGNQISNFVFDNHQSYLPIFSVLVIIYIAQLLLSFTLKHITKAKK